MKVRGGQGERGKVWGGQGMGEGKGRGGVTLAPFPGPIQHLLLAHRCTNNY